jgi:AcrR family transcriptional regulator
LALSGKEKPSTAKSGRRRGVETSKSRAKLIDAAARLILEEGYAAVTARRVADKAGLKPQLVHYYFPTMDDLLVAVIRRGGDTSLEYLTKNLTPEQPLRAVWQLSGDVETAILSMQYLALATHRKTVRAEVKRYAEQIRALQTAALTRHFEARETESSIPPIAAMLMMTAISHLLHLEQALGISLGHKETKACMEKYLADLQSSGKAAVKKAKSKAVKTPAKHQFTKIQTGKKPAGTKNRRRTKTK